jgi:hypothetical protein
MVREVFGPASLERPDRRRRLVLEEYRRRALNRDIAEKRRPKKFRRNSRGRFPDAFGGDVERRQGVTISIRRRIQS